MAERQMPGALVVTPTYNERNNLLQLVAGVRAALPHADLWIVDDASPDGTGQLAEQLAARDRRVKVVHRRGKLGLGGAYLEAFRAGLRQKYEFFFQIDADLSHDPAALPRLAHELSHGADVVIGSRNVPGGAALGWHPLRHVLSRGGSACARWVLGHRVRDMTSGFKGFTGEALRRLELETVRSRGYSFQIELTHRALLAGLEVREVPIHFVDRRLGQSKMSGAVLAGALGTVARLRWDAVKARR